MKFNKAYISIVLSTVLILGTGWDTVAKASDGDREYKLKAAFLLNFSKFTTWPEEAFAKSPDNFNFCVVGEDPFGSNLRGLETKKVGGRNIELLYPDSPAEQKRCHVMFVSKSEKGKLRELQQVASGLPVVTVSDIKGFSRYGGTFEFVTRAGKLSFIVNNNQAKKNGLQINASLLNLAAQVL